MSALARLLPALDRPPEGAARAGLALLLVCDVLLVALLPHALVVLACAATAFIGVLVSPRLSWALALLVVGYPLLDPITDSLGTPDPGFFALRILLLTAIVWILFAVVRQPGSLLAGLASDPIALWAVVLGLIVTLGLLHTPTPVYGREKVVAYVATNLPLLAGGYFLTRRHDEEEQRRRDRRFEAFLLALVSIGVLISVISVLNLFLRFYAFRSRLTVLGLNPIWLARIMGISVLAVLSLWDTGRIRTRSALALVAPIGAILILTGSRGPLLSLLAVLALRALVFTRASAARRVGAALAGLAAGAVLFAAMPDDLRERFLHPMGVDVSGATRMKFVEVAGSALSSALGWGLGTGGFSDLLSKGDYRFYPHNLFAEVGIENGLPGLLALFGFLGSGMARALRAARDPYVLAAFLGFLYAFLNAQFSGDLMANEWIWLFAGLIAGRTR